MPPLGPASLVVGVTLVGVALAVAVHYEGLTALGRRFGTRRERPSRRTVLKMIFGLLALHVVEIWLFGFAYWGLMAVEGTGDIAGAHEVGLFDAVYLSAITFTTVGFGDLAPVGPIRFLSGSQALTGLLLITWSASFTYLEMSRHWRDDGR
ncbi:potassium channel family protein [Vulcaniibacterium thermophilum]|uniref:Ion transporter n=1 Tax=Vulcaniibacterium thermophilum TaxID=1169913 RepID=A0A919DGT8_9GAMM|nr:potassium channel family protein [Vulcaniibacterium thermophilum]GHE43060.1 ion transporter [Vulcaniibacterium thermophilum]